MRVLLACFKYKFFINQPIVLIFSQRSDGDEGMVSY